MKLRGRRLAAIALGMGLSLGLGADLALAGRVDPAARGSAQTATAQPDWWSVEYDPRATPQPKDDGLWVVKGRLSIDEPEAHKDAIARLGDSVRLWLRSQLSVPVESGWEPDPAMIEGLIRERFVDTVDAPASVASETPTMKIAGYQVDFSIAARERFLAAYEHEVAVERLWTMGSAILGVLVLLGVFSGYIRADESTKGYFTNWLRLTALATAAGGAGAVYYFLLS